jgi:ATP-binding cassette subfamily F protein uup
MQFLKLNQISKRYGEKLLFENIDLTISKGDKIALVAKNGSGKSTLLRIIAGIESPEGEQASIELAKGVKTSFLKQDFDFYPTDTIEEIIFETNNERIKVFKAYKDAQEGNNESRLEELTREMDRLNAWSIQSKIEETLSKLKLDNLQQRISELSGGQVKRVALARLFLEEAEFMVLDEPTNHLDIEIIEWLEEHLSNPNFTIFMVTHDRYFLDRVCNHIIELEDGCLDSYKGNYSEYLEKKSLKQQNDSARLDKVKKLFKKELDWIRRQPKARGTKEKSRVDKFQSIKEESKKRIDDTQVQLKIKENRLGSKILELHNISKSFDKLLFENFSYKFRKGEKLGLVGPNGVGKSTFINVITGQLRPDTGKVIVGDTIKFGYYSQHGLVDADDKTVIDVIRDIAEYIPLEKGLKLTAETLLERFMFPRPQQRVRVSELSGGEKRRLYLLTVLMENPNFLILDEPTNDLDIMTLQVLETYLEEFNGCVLVITHDRFFLDRIADHLFIMEGEGKVKDYNGSYSEYRLLKNDRSQSDDGLEVPEKESASKLDYEMKKKVKNQVRKLEREIENLEVEKSGIQTKFIENTDMSVEEIDKLSKRLGEIRSELEEKELEWMEASEKLEES